MDSFVDIFKVFVHEFITLFSEMAPFLLLGFLLAGVLHVWVPNHLYVPKISKSNFMSVLWAALFGVPLPICSFRMNPNGCLYYPFQCHRGGSANPCPMTKLLFSFQFPAFFFL